MVTPSRVRMNNLRHKHGIIAKEDQEAKKNKNCSKEEPLSEEEHKKRLDKLKEIGILK